MNKFAFAGLTAAALAATTIAAAPAAAVSMSLTQFGTQGISFQQDTQVRFTFNRSVGSFQSTLGIYEGSPDNLVSILFQEDKPFDNPATYGTPVGSFGNAVSAPGAGTITRYFTFLAGRVYSLGLDSTPNGRVFTTSAWNPNGDQQAVFVPGEQPALPGSLTAPFASSQDTGAFNNPSAYSSVANPYAVFTIGFDDRGNRQDKDFQDFVVSAQAVPEPFTMAGTALAGIGYMVARKRKQQKSEANA